MTTQAPKTLLQFFLHFIRQQWYWLIVIQLLCFCWSANQIVWPYIIQQLIDMLTTYANQRDQIWSVLKPLIVMSIVFWWIIEACYRASGIVIAYIFPKIEASVRLSMFNYIERHSQRYFADQLAGSLANKINDMSKGITAVLQLLLTLFIPGFVALILAVTLFAHLQAPFAWLLAIWLVIHFGICFSTATYCDRRAAEHAETRSTLVGRIVDSLTNISAVRAFARHRFEAQDLARYQKIEQVKNKQALMAIEKVKIFLGWGEFLFSFFALNAYALYAWKNRQISVGDYVLIFNTAWNVTMVAWYVGLQLPSFFKEVGTCRQALAPLQIPHEIIDAPGAQSLVITNGEIAFEKVNFHYDKYRLFEDKTVIIPGGKKVGLVGFSGSGKTTFVNLIMRYFELKSGAILIDGQNIAKVTQDSLHEQIALIPQDPSLFHRSLLENIRYSNINATEQEVIAAAKAAHCHEFINVLPQQYDTLVGERGIKLSGGQRQRIAIARAILKNAPILILDEATSALDSVTEQLIQDSLLKLMQCRTTIVIAHRLSTLAQMDELLVFDAGRIIEQGSHADLLAKNGHYALLWRMQAGGFLPEQQ